MAQAQDRPLFVLWLDAHKRFHTPKSNRQRNLQMARPLGYVTGPRKASTLSLICPNALRHDKYSDSSAAFRRRRRNVLRCKETTIQRVRHARD